MTLQLKKQRVKFNYSNLTSLFSTELTRLPCKFSHTLNLKLYNHHTNSQQRS
ncbi:hypothetical protein CSUNSWCD_1955 [Campylobacter showae CSUNSWCD]|uniref:Uncharacterized protein n=1 Tax=Campylobacter showae CSUNSWCD TaxID=1244083 RepID=M5IQ58_9BACT|nr:hypothetical protein CSUNSWCD_1955 [Campylobacter showae CSUNSWCD]